MKIAGILAVTLATALVAAQSAFAGVATYNSTGLLHVSDDSVQRRHLEDHGPDGAPRSSRSR